MIVIVDRFEGDYAVCETENRQMINVDKSKLPKDTVEGSVLVISNGNIIIDYDETEKRRNKINKLMNGLWK